MSSESDSVSPPLTVEKCSLVLVDVAGTTTSIDFVKDTLFPFAVGRAEAFLSAKWDEDAVKECVSKIWNGDQELDAVAVAERVKTLTEQNSSNEGLKTLQGLIYKEGYEKGDLKAHVFDDVAGAFEAWAKSRRVAVYSTGSVDAQKLLFAHTVAGDLSTHISNYFDQTVGAKTEADSYKKIAEETKTPPEEVVFVTDDAKEAAAAKAGGVHAVLIKREGNPALPEEACKEFTVVTSFAELPLDKTCKRKVDEEESANVEAPPSKVPKTDPEGQAADGEAAAVGEAEQEPMEVDAAESGKTKAVSEETENLVKNAPEKTETDEKEAKDAEMKEADDEKAQSEAVEAESVIEEKAAAEEEKAAVEETESTTEAVKEKEAITEKAQSTKDKKTVETESDKPVEETKVEETEPSAAVAAAVESLEPIAEEPEAQAEEETDKKEEAQSSTEKAAETVTDEEKEAQSTVEDATKEADKEEAAEEAQGQKKEEAKREKPEEAKPEEAKAEEEEGAVKNGEEEAETSAPKAEEKENKSVLANGVENGNKDESEVDNATDEKESETAEVTNDDNVDNKDDDNEVKVKKLEESAESKTVSVEV